MEESLHIGDVVYLSFPTYPSYENPFIPTLDQGPEGPLTNLTPNSDFSFALFQIVPFIPPSVLSDPSQPEYRAYQDEVKDLYQKPLVYGTDITLRHVFSSQLLYVDTATASDNINTWRVSVGRATSQFSSTLIRISPLNSSSEDGKEVKQIANVSIDFVCERITLLLGVSEGTNVLNCGTEQRLSVSLSLYDDSLGNMSRLKFLYPVVIRHSKLGECLALDSKSKELRLKQDATLDAYWICEATQPDTALIKSDLVLRLRHAFYPVYLLHSGGTSPDGSDNFSIVPCSSSSSNIIENASGVFLYTQANKRLTVPTERIDEFLLTKFLPYPASVDLHSQAITEVEIAENATDLIFEVSHVSDDYRMTYMEMKTIVAAYHALLTALQSGADPQALRPDLERIQRLEAEVISAKTGNQMYTDMLVAFGYHRAIFGIVCLLATPDKKDEHLINTLVKSLRLLVKGNMSVTDLISEEAEKVKDLIKNGYLSAGKLYCTIIRESQSVAPNVQEFCEQWFSELESVENTEKKNLYVKMLISACRSMAGNAWEVRKCVAEILGRKRLMSGKHVEQLAEIDENSPLKKYMSRVLLLYSAVFRGFENSVTSLLLQAGLNTQRLTDIIGSVKNREISKACATLRANMFLASALKFLEQKDENYLYDLSQSLEQSGAIFPYSIGGAQGLDDMSKDLWHTLVAPKWRVEELPDTLVEKLETLLEQLHRAKDLIDECTITDVFLYCLRVSLSALFWAYGSSTDSKQDNPLKIFSLINLAMESIKATKEKTETQPYDKNSARIKSLLTSVFSAAISLYSLICKIKQHRDVDFLLLSMHEKFGSALSQSQVSQLGETESFKEFVQQISKSILEKDEIALWRKAIASRGVEDQDEEVKDLSAEVDEALNEIERFAKMPEGIDRLVIWTLLNSHFTSGLSSALRRELEDLLLTLFFPKRTAYRCLRQSVFVEAFVDVKSDLESIVRTLISNSTQHDILNESFTKALIRICNLLLVQLNSKELVKTQGIMRNLKLHKAMAPYLMKASECRDKAEIRTLCATFMYRFVCGNSLNKKALLKVITKPVQFWETQQFVSFMSETVDLSEVSLGETYRMMKRVLTDLLNANEAQYSQYILTGLLFDRNCEPSIERQHILTRLVLATNVDDSDIRRKALVFKLLSKCAIKNEPVVSQCRVFCSLAKLASYVRKQYDPAVLLEYISFFHNVYLQNFGKQLSPVISESVTEILRTAWNRSFPFSQDLDRFRTICEEGRYIVVRCYNNPYKRELTYMQQSDSFLSAWNLISYGSMDLTKTGLLRAIEEAGRLFKFNDKNLLEFFSGQLVYDLISLARGVREMEREFDVSLLLERIEAALSVVQGVLGNPVAITESIKELSSKKMNDPSFLHLLKNVGSMQHLVLGGSKPAESERNISTIAAKVKSDEILDEMVAIFAQTYKSVLETKKEVGQIVEMWKFNSWSDTLAKYAGLKSLLYRHHRIVFFNILRNLAATPEAAKFRNELFDACLRNGTIDITVETILRARTKKEQCAALQFLSEFVTDLESEGFDKLKIHMERTRKAGELFLFFYKAISTLTSQIQTRKFQFIASEPLLLEPITQFYHKRASLVIEILKFVRTACDNLNTTWQHFFRKQGNPDSDVDLLTEITKLVSTQGRYSKISVLSQDASALVVEGLNALIELTSGSENENAQIVMQELSLFPALNSMFEKVFDRLKEMASVPGQFSARGQDSELSDVVSVFQSLSLLLLALTEGREETCEVFVKYLRLDMLLTQSVWLHEYIIETRMSQLELGKDSKAVEDLVASAIYVRIFLVKMSKLTPCPVKLLTLISPISDSEKAADRFYSKYTGTVEITDDKTKNVVKMYFPIPFKCHFLTYETYLELVMQPADKPRDEKLETILKLRVMCQDEMEHQQKMSENEMQKFVTHLWQVYGHISIILLVIINALLIFSLTEKDTMGKFTKENWVRDYVHFFGFLQLVMGVTSYVCHFLEYLPANTKNYEEGQSFSFQEFCRQQDNASLLEFEKLHQAPEPTSKSSPITSMKVTDIIFICFRLKSFYFLFYLTFSLLGFIWYIAYPVLMLDCIRRFGSLSRLLRAITNTWQQLMITLAFETIIVYIFAIIGFLLFEEDYKDDDGVLNCATLFNCFLSTLKTGITQGGIGGELTPTSSGKRMVFDMLFWSLVIVVMLNITFGIIIDSYSGLREDYRLMIEKKDGECFVCGEDRDNIESKGESWTCHIEMTHALRTYIFLCVYLSKKDAKECSGLEKTVKSKIEKYDTSFFPHALESDKE